MITYTGSKYSIAVDDKEGHILSLKKDGKEFVCKDTALPLFNIRLRAEHGEQTEVSAYDAKSSHTVSDGNSHTIMYGEFGGVDLTVKVFVSFDEQIKWRIDIENNTALWLEWVDFPQLAVPNNLKANGGDSRILWGLNEGVIIEDINKRDSKSWQGYTEPEYPSTGGMGIFPAIVGTQFMAYFDSNCGLYLGTHDNQGNLKGIDFYLKDNGIKMQFRLFTGADKGEDFRMEYDFVMDTFNGDWHSAAEIYRVWFETGKSAEFVKIGENPCIPDWYKDSPIIVTYPVRGLHDMDEMTPNKLFPYINGMKHVDRLSEQLDSKIMVVLMHWEGTAPWAPPIVWPPYGGEEAFKEFADALHAEGHLLGVYCSGLGWTYQSNVVQEYNTAEQIERENLKEVMCLSPEGDLPLSKICTGQRSGYDMCPAHSFTKEVIAGQVKKMTEGDVDYIQVLDQNHGGTSYFCYSDAHGHPKMPGRWQTQAMISLHEQLKEYTNGGGKKILMGCESAAAETYIPWLLFSDNRYNTNYFIGAATPVYAYVYHQYVNNFMGNQVCTEAIFDHKRSPENLMYRIAHSFCAGDMLTVVINQNGEIAWNWGRGCASSFVPEQQPVIEFMKNANAWRRVGGVDFLHYGKMTRPMSLNMPKENIIYMPNGCEFKADKLLTSCWEAADGRVGQFIINYNDADVYCEIELDGVSGYAISDNPYDMNLCYTTVEGKKTVGVTVKALSTVLIEMKRGAL